MGPGAQNFNQCTRNPARLHNLFTRTGLRTLSKVVPPDVTVSFLLAQ